PRGCLWIGQGRECQAHAVRAPGYPARRYGATAQDRARQGARHHALKRSCIMNRILALLTGVLIPLLAAGPAGAWGHADAYGGGSTSHSYGSTTRTNAYGGSATHTAGQGTSASNAYGGSAYHAEGSGTTTASNAYGGSATHYAGGGTVGTSSYYGYHPPTTVAVYGSGCYNCGASGWAVAGAAIGGAVVGA